MANLRRIPAPLHQVSEHLLDDDLAWLNDHLVRADLPPVLIRGRQDIPKPVPTGFLRPGPGARGSVIDLVVEHMNATLAGTPLLLPAVDQAADHPEDLVCDCGGFNVPGVHLARCRSTTVRVIADPAGPA